MISNNSNDVKKYLPFSKIRAERYKFNVGEKVNIKGILLGMFHPAIILQKNEDKTYKVKYIGKSEYLKTKIVQESLLSDPENVYGIFITPYKNNEEFGIHDKKFTIFSLMYVIDDLWDDITFYSYIFVNHDTKEWCFLYKNKFYESQKIGIRTLDDKSNNEANISFLNFFNEYFSEKLELKLQDDKILSIIGKLDAPYVRISDELIKKEEYFYKTYVVKPRSNSD